MKRDDDFLRELLFRMEESDNPIHMAPKHRPAGLGDEFPEIFVVQSVEQFLMQQLARTEAPAAQP